MEYTYKINGMGLDLNVIGSFSTGNHFKIAAISVENEKAFLRAKRVICRV